MRTALLAASTSGLQQWWDGLPPAWKWAALAASVAFLVVGVVKKIVLLALVAGLVAGGLLATAWWASRH